MGIMKTKASVLLAEADSLRKAADLLEKAAQLLQESSMNGKPRLDQLADFLREHGPCKRRIVRENSGLPEGTIAAYLHKRTFDRSEEGLWSVRGLTSSVEE